MQESRHTKGRMWSPKGRTRRLTLKHERQRKVRRNWPRQLTRDKRENIAGRTPDVSQEVTRGPNRTERQLICAASTVKEQRRQLVDNSEAQDARRRSFTCWCAAQSSDATLSLPETRHACARARQTGGDEAIALGPGLVRSASETGSD